jgi:nucleoside-diphosphate-sugar epimerase
MAKILIIGCGDIGGALANQLVIQGHQVTGLKRKPPTTKTAVSYIKGDVTVQEAFDDLTLDFDQVIYILSPSGRGLEGYQAVFETGVINTLKAFKDAGSNAAFTFVSSSRVYGQQTGEWINEKSPAEPTDERGKILLAAEKKFLVFNDRTTIIRFSGIYGRSNYFVNQLKTGVGIQKEPPYYTNRIHQEDCIRALTFIINKKFNGDKLRSIYLATDNNPATKWDVASFLTQSLTLPKPTALSIEKSASSNKRLENKRLIEEGFEFKFKSYEDGYSELFNG